MPSQTHGNKYLSAYRSGMGRNSEVKHTIIGGLIYGELG